jgi:quercetin dioxygenase-like cupin family protein
MSFVLPEVNPDDLAYRRRGALYVPAGQGPTRWAVNDVYTIKALAAQTNGTIGFIEASVPPGGGPGPHMHPHEEETFYMLSGELEFLDGDHTFTAMPGDFVHVPRGTRHRFLNKGAHTAKMIFMFTPAGPETVIADLAQPAVPGEMPPSQIEPDQLARFEEMNLRSRVVRLPDPS